MQKANRGWHLEEYCLVVVTIVLAAALEAHIGSYIGRRPLYFGIVLYFALFGDYASAILALLLCGLALHFTMMLPKQNVSDSVETVAFIIEGIAFIGLSWRSRRAEQLKREALLQSDRIKETVKWLEEFDQESIKQEEIVK